MNVGQHVYKGIDVWYDDFNERWECELDRSHRRHIQTEKLQDLRKRIDTFVKKERKFERYEAIALNGSGYRQKRGNVVTVTSHCDEPDEGYCWVVDAEGNRSKEAFRGLALNIPENRAAYDEEVRIIAESEKTERQARKRINALAIGYEPDDDDE